MPQENYTAQVKRPTLSDQLPQIMGRINSIYGEEKFRIIECLRASHKLTNEEIAKVLGVTPRAIRSLVKRYSIKYGEATKAVDCSHKAAAVGSILTPRTEPQEKVNRKE